MPWDSKLGPVEPRLGDMVRLTCIHWKATAWLVGFWVGFEGETFSVMCCHSTLLDGTTNRHDIYTANDTWCLRLEVLAQFDGALG